MPKLKKFKPVEVEEREAELRKRYGGMMSSADVSEERLAGYVKVMDEWHERVKGLKEPVGA